jgi:predicted aspartyl protease
VIDGVYGETTRTAIVAWQTARGRAASGFLGEADARAIEQEVAAAVPSPQAALVPKVQPTTTPTPALAPTVSASDEVSLTEKGGTYLVPVRINDAITLDFLIDSGASDVLIPADVVMTLFRTKTLSGGDFLDERTYVL